MPDAYRLLSDLPDGAPAAHEDIRGFLMARLRAGDDPAVIARLTFYLSTYWPFDPPEIPNDD